MTDGRRLTFVQLEAIGRYVRDAERAASSGHSEHRLDAIQSLERARKTLPDQEKAILDLIAVKGRTVADLAKRTGRPTGDLHRLFARAANDLATHYETEDAA